MPHSVRAGGAWLATISNAWIGLGEVGWDGKGKPSAPKCSRGRPLVFSREHEGDPVISRARRLALFGRGVRAEKDRHHLVLPRARVAIYPTARRHAPPEC